MGLRAISSCVLFVLLQSACGTALPRDLPPPHCHGVTCQEKSDETQYVDLIVGFHNYSGQREHAEYLTETLSSVSSQWSVIPRENAASGFPTDFLVLRLPGSGEAAVSLTRRLEGLAKVRYVMRDSEITRSLKEATVAAAAVAAEDDFGCAGGRLPIGRSWGNTSFSQPEAEEEDGEAAGIARGPSRSLLQGAKLSPPITQALGADALWGLGITGKGVRVAIFDTGLSASHPHFRNIRERTDWTNEKTLDDALGHGTFVAGVIASQRECLGFAPDADIYAFRVFTTKQVSHTSWFLDAFNYAIHTQIDVLNLSIGGPDFLDKPFVDKVSELVANGVIVVSAIGNDGPLYGTLSNPADMMSVIGVGGLDSNDRIAKFSSRGMTTWELPSGYGRVKPDIVTYGRSIRGSKPRGGCRELSGTSVASPVVAGAVALLVSSMPLHESGARITNPASVKQALVASARRVPEANMFEQGAGSIDLAGAYQALRSAPPHASVIPAQLDLTASGCPYMWPYCAQPLYHSSLPVLVNLTVLNSMSITGRIAQTLWKPADAHSEALELAFSHPPLLWPWSGWLAVHISVKAPQRKAWVAKGIIHILVLSDRGDASTIELPLKADVIPTPSRKRRLLWDQFHSLRYPSGYFPRDNLQVRGDTLDWNGDHPHTNFREAFEWLRSNGYYLEVLGSDYTCFDASLYGALLIVDTEEEFFPEEVAKLEKDVTQRGLSLIVFAEWYSIPIMNSIRFFDENTKRWWHPLTGGGNLPALNDLLAPYGIALADNAYWGTHEIAGQLTTYASGTAIARFPAGGYMLPAALRRVPDDINFDGDVSQVRHHVPILGGVSLNGSAGSAGRIAVYGDSNCLDMTHRATPACTSLLSHLLDFALEGRHPPAFSASHPHSQPAFLPLREAYSKGSLPERQPLDASFARHSNVLRAQGPQCSPAKPSRPQEHDPAAGSPQHPSPPLLKDDTSPPLALAGVANVTSAPPPASPPLLLSRPPSHRKPAAVTFLSLLSSPPLLLLILLLCAGLIWAGWQWRRTRYHAQDTGASRSELTQPGSETDLLHYVFSPGLPSQAYAANRDPKRSRSRPFSPHRIL